VAHRSHGQKIAFVLNVWMFLDLLECAVLLAIVEDALRGGPPGASQFFDLFDRGRVEIDGRLRAATGLSFCALILAVSATANRMASAGRIMVRMGVSSVDEAVPRDEEPG
jgi:hypothetical protein